MEKKIIQEIKDTFKKYTYEEVADILNDLYEISHTIDNRKFKFTSDRYGHKLFLTPIPQHSPYEYVDITPSNISTKYDADFGIFVANYFDDIVDEILEEEDNKINKQMLEDIILYTWTSYIYLERYLEDCGFIVRKKYDHELTIIVW